MKLSETVEVKGLAHIYILHFIFFKRYMAYLTSKLAVNSQYCYYNLLQRDYELL